MANVSKFGYVAKGYAQVEPNHLSAQRTGQIYAQLPSDADILENGQFVKYDYAAGKVVTDVEGAGEWMLVFNEVKTYYDYEPACNFAMKAENYNARIYSPSGAATNGAAGLDYSDVANAGIALDGTATPMQPNLYSGPVEMTGNMVPRVFKTNVGDIMTTNAILEKDGITLGATLKVDDNGLLSTKGTSEMAWKVAKIYTMPDGQPGVKIVRIA